MALDKTLGLEHGDIVRVVKLTKLQRLGPTKNGFSYDYVRECLDEENERSNEDITAIAKELVAVRKRTMELLTEVRNTKRRK